ncbi:protein pollenless 3, partial [Quercus suber]
MQNQLPQLHDLQGQQKFQLYDLFNSRGDAFASFCVRYWDITQSNPVHIQQLFDCCYSFTVRHHLMVVGTADCNLIVFNLQNPQDLSGSGESSTEPGVAAVAPMEGLEAPTREKPSFSPVPVVSAPISAAPQSVQEPGATAEAPAAGSDAPMRTSLPSSSVLEARAPISVISQSQFDSFQLAETSGELPGTLTNLTKLKVLRKELKKTLEIIFNCATKYVLGFLDAYHFDPLQSVRIAPRQGSKQGNSLFWSAINAGDWADSALKDMAIAMKQLDQSDKAIEAIKSFHHLCPYDSQESLDNLLVELYK